MAATTDVLEDLRVFAAKHEDDQDAAGLQRTWLSKAAAAKKQLGGDYAAMIDSYLAALPDDLADGNYGDELAAVQNSIAAVVANLSNMLTPPADPVPGP